VQVGDLGFHIANPKSLNLSDPACGKTPVVCVLSYYYSTRLNKRTLWANPKSLLEKNKDEFALFTNFTPDQIEILESDFAPLTRNWTGPTMVRIKTTRSMRVRLGDGTDTHHRELPEGTYVYSAPLSPEQGPGWATLGSNTVLSSPPENATFVHPILGPDDKPQFVQIDEEETVKDLIADAHQRGVQVLLFTFAFMRNNADALIEKFPDADLLLVDEWHLGYGGPESGQTKSLYKIMKHCSAMCGMTGTLIDGKLDSSFPAIHVIEPNYYGSYGGFIDEHADFIDDYGKVKSWKNHDKISKILARHTVRHTFEEVYGPEPVQFFTKVVPMGPKCREKYDEFHQLAMLELEDMSVLDGSLPGVNQIRARQIMAHPETMGIARGETTSKDKLIAGYATEGRPLLVFAALQPEQRRLQKLLQDCGLRVGLINADVLTSKRDEIDKSIRAGQLDAIVGSGPTVAVGYNWQKADHVVFASIDYKDVNILQAYRRASRGTRTTPLRVTFLQYEDSIDQRMYDIVKMKSEEARKVDPTRRMLEVA
jgi:hypothetical protein